MIITCPYCNRVIWPIRGVILNENDKVIVCSCGSRGVVYYNDNTKESKIRR